MKNNVSKAISIILVFLCFNSLVYYQLPEANILKDEDSLIEDYLPVYNEEIQNEDKDNAEAFPISKSITPGSYQTQAFFPGGTGFIYGDSRVGETLIYDPDTFNPDPLSGKNIIEWVPYDDIKDDGTLGKELYWRALSTNPLLWPNNTDWFYLRETGNPNEPSKVYSPVFTEEYELSGKIHWMSYLEVNNSAVFSEAITIGYRLQLFLFNPADGNTTLIASNTRTYPISMSSGQKLFSADIIQNNNYVIIPAGYRLRWDIRVRFSSVPSTGSFLQNTGYDWNGGGSTTWTIDNGIYSSSYTINNVTRMAGIQLYMRSRSYPDINVTNVANNTVYQTAQAINIDVTDGSISSYSWDGNPSTSFDNETITNVPTTFHGWHDLEITSSDPLYGNSNTTNYLFGYDASETNVVLLSPINGSSLVGGTVLDFEVSNVDNSTYEWNNNGSIFDLTSPHDIYVPYLEGELNLTIKTSDFYENTSFFYIFYTDSDNPLITLLHIANGSTQGPWKTIQVEITDSGSIDTVLYHWDSESETQWSPVQGNTYQTNLPNSTIWHTLYIFVNDSLGHQSESIYEFLTDDAIFLVELSGDVVDGGHYLGGETVIITAQETSGTIFYQWDGGTLKDGSSFLISNTLVLNGSDVIPSDPGLHNLTIITYNTTLHEFVFSFFFLVDTEKPIIGDVSAINDNRFESSEYFTFTISDNNASVSDLTVLFSIDDTDNITLVAPSFQINLADLSLAEGFHEFYIYVFDLAGNYEIQYVFFYIDNVAPVVEIIIPDLVTLNSLYYLAENELIIVSVYDEDPDITTEYIWNSGIPQPFVGSFILPYIDVAGSLVINAYDSKNHLGVDSISIIIDGTVPVINIIPDGLIHPDNGSIINDNTFFEFEMIDTNMLTIKEIIFNWNATTIKDFWSDPIENPTSFVLPLMGWYDNDENARVSLRVEDYLGHIAFYNFTFDVDNLEPVIELYYYDEGSILRELEPNQLYNVEASTEIWYNSLVNQDLKTFNYLFVGYESGSISSSNNWTFFLPDNDGTYTLNVTLIDSVISDNPNKVTATYYFEVNDIDVEFVNPIETEWIGGISYNLQMVYTDNFTFTVNITDIAYGLQIDGLKTRIEHNDYFLYTLITNTSSVYQCYIEATNVTNEIETRVDFVFYEEGEASQTLSLYLTIIKKRGILNLVEEQSVLAAKYDSEVTIALNLQSHLGVNQTITYIEVNNQEISPIYFTDNNNTAWFNYSTHGMVKGNNVLNINASSIFFFDDTDENYTIEINIIPLTLVLDIQVSNYTVLENTQLIITFSLTFQNGTPVTRTNINYTIYVFQFLEDGEVTAYVPDNYTRTISDSVLTDDNGNYTTFFTMSEDVDYIMITASFGGGIYTDSINVELAERVEKTFPVGFPSWLIYVIIGGAIGLVGIVSILVYKFTRAKPLEEIMESISEVDVDKSLEKLSPGVILTIFDQRKGPIPLIGDHSLDTGRYLGRMQIGVENFLLKISDQAYSSLGFEEHDAGRRVGSIILPTEKMIGFVHGVQLPNKMARGGFENLSLIVLAESDVGNLLLNNQEFLYKEVDKVIDDLKSKKNLKLIEEQLVEIRRRSVKIMIGSEKLEAKKN